MIRIRHILATIAALLAVASPLLADNKFGINDELNAIYERAQKVRSSSKCLAIADTMRTKAIEIGDLKAECISLTIPTAYYFATRDSALCNAAVDELKEVSRRNGYLQYYYYGSNLLITMFINSGKIDRAAAKAAEMKADALVDDYPYAIYQCYIASANIYVAARADEVAFNYYRKAIDYNRTHDVGQSTANAYMNLVYLAQARADYQGMIDVLTEARDEVEKYGNASTKIKYEEYFCLACFMLGRYDEFAAHYRLSQELIKKDGNNARPDEIVAIMWNIYNGKRDPSIMAGMDHLKTVGVKYHIIAELYKQVGDYGQYLDALESAFNVEITRRVGKVEDDIINMAVSLENYALMADKVENQLLAQEKDNRIRQMRFIIGLITGFIALSALVFLIIVATRRKYRSEKLNDEERYNFLIHVGHEFRTPLTLIIGKLSRIRTAPVIDESFRERITSTRRQSARITTLLDTMDAVSTLDTGSGRHLDRDIVDTNLWVSETINGYSADIDNCGLSLKLDLDPDAGRIDIDKAKCQVVMSNMVINALRFIDKGTTVTVGTRRMDRNNVRISFSGPCSSLTKEMSAMFQKDYRHSNDRMGANMSIIYSRPIVEAHSGEMGIVPDYDHNGVEFFFELPSSKV